MLYSIYVMIIPRVIAGAKKAIKNVRSIRKNCSHVCSASCVATYPFYGDFLFSEMLIMINLHSKALFYLLYLLLIVLILLTYFLKCYTRFEIFNKPCIHM